MKYKHIQAAHEARMWIMTIATGIVAAEAMLARHPVTKAKIQSKIERIKCRFTKEEPETTNERIIKVVIVDPPKES